MTDTNQPTTNAALADELERGYHSARPTSGYVVTHNQLNRILTALRAPAQVEGEEIKSVVCQECDPPGCGKECRGRDCSDCHGTGRMISTAALTRPTAAPDDEAVRLLGDIVDAYDWWQVDPVDRASCADEIEEARAYLARQGDA